MLSADEVEHTLGLIWGFLEAQGTGVRRGEPRSWADDDWSPSGGNPGLHPAYGLAQSEAAWFVRGKDRVQRVWAVRPLRNLLLLVISRLFFLSDRMLVY